MQASSGVKVGHGMGCLRKSKGALRAPPVGFDEMNTAHFGYTKHFCWTIMGDAKGGEVTGREQLPFVPLPLPFSSPPPKKKLMVCPLVTIRMPRCYLYKTLFLQNNPDICDFFAFSISKSRQICGFHCMSKS